MRNPISRAIHRVFDYNPNDAIDYGMFALFCIEASVVIVAVVLGQL